MESERVNGTGSGTGELRKIPSVDAVLGHASMQPVWASLPHAIGVRAVREELAGVRARVKVGGDVPDVENIASAAATRAWLIVSPSLRRVINATGVVVHTNLGRAPLSQAAVEAVARVAAYSNLEYDLAEGERGSRYVHAVEVLCTLTGCEDALVVNNNAAALVLALAALAKEREVVVSRGQLVEIGGGFRIPEIMAQGGAQLREVGTTNRTYVADYEAAIGERTAALMHIHASNFKIVGFHTAPTISELAVLAHKHNLLVIDDVGSGALIDTTQFGLAPEPQPKASVKAGADLVLFSGDKLLGGPQSGLMVGKRDVIARLRKHPLARALRVDKMTLAALETTLLHYVKGEALTQVPVWRMISAGERDLKTRAGELGSRLSDRGVKCEIEPGVSAVGGGSLPGETLPTWLVAVKLAAIGTSDANASAGRLAEALRLGRTPVVGRVEHGRLLLDLRTVSETEEPALIEAVVNAWSLAPSLM